MSDAPPGGITGQPRPQESSPRILLSELLGAPVSAPSGRRLGKLFDVAARLDRQHPRVSRIAWGSRRRHEHARWSDVAGIGRDIVEVRDLGGVADTALGEDEIWLRRHVLDAQVIDVGGRRLVRVGDVGLDPRGRELVLSGVEIDAGAVLRRLGLGRLARSFPAEFLDWAEVHVASGRGHSVQLQTATSRVHALSADELEAVVGGLTPARAAELREVAGAPKRDRRIGHRRRFRHVLRARRRAPS